MPLATEPDSDWEDSKAIYIQALKDPINSGCLTCWEIGLASDFIPQQGFQVTATGVLFPFQIGKLCVQVPRLPIYRFMVCFER